MPEPEVKDPPVSTEDPEYLMSIAEPAGGLKNMIEMMSPPRKDEDDDDKKKDEEKIDENSDDKKKKDEKKEETPSDLEKMKPEELVLEVKKHQTLVNEVSTKHKELETKYKELEAKQGTVTDEKVNTFLSEFRIDPTKAYEKHQKELNLPDISLFRGLINSPNDNVLKLKHYQETELKPLIEKTFKLDSGTFKFDADEAEDPTKPSAMWRKLTRTKENELDNELTSAITLQNEQTKKAREGQAEDKTYLAATLFGGDVKKADEAIKELHELPSKILKGEAPPSQHPFRLRTLVLGVNHERLMKENTEKVRAETEEKIIKAFNNQGLYLKEPMPEDLKSIKKTQSFAKKQEYTGNPATDAMIRTLNQ